MSVAATYPPDHNYAHGNLYKESLVMLYVWQTDYYVIGAHGKRKGNKEVVTVYTFNLQSCKECLCKEWMSLEACKRLSDS